jgi:transcriptional regulator with XRE-family HTH domain
MMTDYIGRRVARWRDIAGMTQQQLADAVGVSRSYVSLIESGGRAVTKRSLLIDFASALGVSVPQLLDQPPHIRDRDDLVMSRAAAAVRVALDGDGPAVRPVVETLPARADAIVSIRAACDYPALAEALPALIDDARAVAYDDGADEDTRRVGLGAMVKAGVYGAYALKTSGYVDLAVRLAEHSHCAAGLLDSPVHVAASAMARCQVLMAEGVRGRALTISTGAADALQSELDRDGARGWYVSLRLQAALCAASLDDYAGASAHLDDAADVAAGSGLDTWHRDDQATDVNVWRVTVALEDNGANAERAPDLARRVDRSKLRTPQRLARLYMDTGRGQYARGNREAATNAFLAAYDVAPGEVRNRGTVREIVGQLVRDTPAATGSDRLRLLASRVGVDPLTET